MVLSEIIRRARQCGIRKLVGVYRPTDRNDMVREHYQRLGFCKIEEDDGVTRWEIGTDTEVIAPPMIVEWSSVETNQLAPIGV